MNMLDSGYNHDHSAAVIDSTDRTTESKVSNIQETNHAEDVYPDVADLFSVSMVSDYSLCAYLTN